MSTTVEMKLRPFTVPNYVIVEMPPRSRHEGIVEAPKYAIHELPDETLDDLCKAFRAAVFEKARAGRSTSTSKAEL